MELRSVAYNPTQVPGMQGMQGMQGNAGMMPGMQGMQGNAGMMPGMQGMQGNAGMMPGMQGMQGNAGMMPGMQDMQGMQGNPEMMQGMPMGPGMYPPNGCVNLDVDGDCDFCGPMPCSPCGTPVMPYHQPCPMPTPTPENKVYVVKKGDSVYKIAKRYKTTMQAIISTNKLRNPSRIYPGQILLIPTVATEEFYG